MSYNFTPLKEGIKSVEDWLRKELSGIRTGRASSTILDVISVDSYGSRMQISQVASITTEDARSLRIVPWDINIIKPIEKAITTSDLGLSVSVDEKGLRVTFPELTTERRTSLVKVLKQKLEDARVSLRAEREKVLAELESKQKNGEISEDEKFRLKTEVQKIIDEANKKFDEQAEKKEKEILS